jgi:folylpolyglutamate synthase/dihydropteroate synthase
VTPGAVVVVGEPEWADEARALGAARVDVLSGSNLGLAVAAAEAYVGERVDPAPAETLRIPGRLERRGDRPLELWDGAHNIAGVGYLLGRLPRARFTVVASILADKNVDAPHAALEKARILAGEDGAVLVTGSLYLLADLSGKR